MEGHFAFSESLKLWLLPFNIDKFRSELILPEDVDLFRVKDSACNSLPAV